MKTFDRPDDDLYRTRLLEKVDAVINDVFPQNRPKIYKAGWTVTYNALSCYTLYDGRSQDLCPHRLTLDRLCPLLNL